jgi:hypothetical protein
MSPASSVTWVLGEWAENVIRLRSKRSHSARFFEAVQPSRMSSRPLGTASCTTFSAAISGTFTTGVPSNR